MEDTGPGGRFSRILIREEGSTLDQDELRILDDGEEGMILDQEKGRILDR